MIPPVVALEPVKPDESGKDSLEVSAAKIMLAAIQECNPEALALAVKALVASCK